MIQHLTFLKDYRCFKKDWTIEFRPGLNLIVGDQGSGKSTLLKTIVDMSVNKKSDIINLKAKQCTVFSLDFEKDNPRLGPLPNNQSQFKIGLAVRFKSHGEVINALLESKLMIQDQNMVLVMDEPDMALSVRSIVKLIGLLTKSKSQIICAAHNPMLIESQDNVFDIEASKWVNGSWYVRSQRALEEGK